jgi:signal transduction histidine kinase
MPRPQAGPQRGQPSRLVRATVLRPTGITRRITLLAWSVSLATLAIFVSIIIPEQKRDLRIQLESQASGVAAALHGEIASAAITEDYSPVIDHAMQVLAQDPAVDFLVVSKNDGYALIIERDSWRTEPNIDRYWRSGVRRPSGVIGIVPMFGQRLFHYSAPFDYNGIQWGWIHIGLSLESYDRSSRDVNERTGLLAIACVLLGLVASVSWAGHFVRPIHRLQGVVERVAGGDLTARSDIHSHDEIEQLAHAFNGMADAILHRDRELSESKRDLEIRVTLRTQELSEQIVARDKAHSELAEAQKRLIELSRLSGMAEVATGVLHNVGNVLNSVNVSATIVADQLRESRITQLTGLVQLLQENEAGIAQFLTSDPRGTRILPYLYKLAQQLEKERERLAQEVAGLVRHVGHIKEIVAMQQTYARSSGISEDFAVTSVIDDVLGITRPGIERHGIVLDLNGDELPSVNADRHKVFQILLNLLRNAIDAVKISDQRSRKIGVLTRRLSEDRVAILVRDNGVGIPPANLVRIFSHGFTTKPDGHGFGLHSSALAARELGGALTAESDGTDCGAVFTLELPCNRRSSAAERATA